MIAGFYADHDSGDLAVWRPIRESGIVVVRTEEEGTRRLRDDEHLERATARNLVLVTANYRDFLRIHADWMAAGKQHTGIVVRRHAGTSIGERIRALRAIALRSAPEDLRNQVVYIEALLREKLDQ